MKVFNSLNENQLGAQNSRGEFFWVVQICHRNRWKWDWVLRQQSRLMMNAGLMLGSELISRQRQQLQTVEHRTPVSEISQRSFVTGNQWPIWGDVNLVVIIDIMICKSFVYFCEIVSWKARTLFQLGKIEWGRFKGYNMERKKSCQWAILLTFTDELKVWDMAWQWGIW